jgi:hypothetical protein
MAELRNAYRILVGKPLGNQEHVRVPLRWILKTRVVMGLDLAG